MNDRNKCGAKTRNGSPCLRSPVKGRNRCNLHGGKTLTGKNSPTWKHGLYSKYAGKELNILLEELARLPPSEIASTEHDIRLMQALVISAKALKSDFSDLKELDIMSRVIERLVVAKQRSQTIMIEQQRLIPISDIQRFLNWIHNLLNDELGQKKASQILDMLKSFKLNDKHAP